MVGVLAEDTTCLKCDRFISKNNQFVLSRLCFDCREKEITKPYKVYCSNLTIRFYKMNGWTQELLDTMIDNLEFRARSYFPNDSNPYFTFPIGASPYINFDKLMSVISEINRHPYDAAPESDIDFLRNMI